VMGGQISVSSELGKGSTFGFEICLPLGAQEPEERPESKLAGLTVLIVDDNAANCAFVRDALERAGANARAVADIASARAEISSVAGRYDLVLLDSRISGADGLVLAQDLLRETSFQGKIIAMLNAGKELLMAQRCRELGIHAHVSKPLNYAELPRTVARLLAEGITEARAIQAAPQASYEEAPGLKGLRILVAEDNPVNRKLAVRLLERNGTLVHTANNGREALDLLEELRWEVDIVLTDVQMPEMDGYQVTAAIRARDKQTGMHLPVIAMTAHALDRDREHCLAAGMDGYISKPIRARELFDLIAATMAQAVEVAV
jgi:two-component system sensor histidine kinase/response regulator